MNNETIDELLALLDAGTPGEWECNRSSIITFPNGKERLGCAVCDASGMHGCPNNLNLIVALKNAAPALLSAARENLRLREALEKIAGMNDTGGVLNVSMTMLATETIAKAALGKEAP